jgi:hypothetical protein
LEKLGGFRGRMKFFQGKNGLNGTYSNKHFSFDGTCEIGKAFSKDIPYKS